MFRGFSLFPERASTAAEQVDALMLFLVALTLVMSALIAGLLLYFSFKYRRRPGQETTSQVSGALKLEIFWSVVPLVVGLGIFVWGAKIYFYMAYPPENALEVYVVGKQWMWKIQHPEGQREINELHVPVGQPVKLTLTSEDVIHSLFLPAFRIKVDVIPGRYVRTWFQATRTGRFRFYCAEYCGTDHSGMIGYVNVLAPQDYERWLSSGAEGSLALEGRKLFLMHQCVACHSPPSARGPILEGLYGRPRPLQNGGSVLADETYIRESIVAPDAKIAAGFEPIMPSFAGQIDEEGLIRLVAFIKALGPGQTPPRIDNSPPPATGAAAAKAAVARPEPSAKPADKAAKPPAKAAGAKEKEKR